jgi:Arylsulfotransferase (ASST)
LRFSIAAVAAVVGCLTAAQASARPLPLSSFHSLPGLRPPKVFVSGKVPDPRAGDIFGDAQNSIQAGPLILGPSGKLLWFDALPNRGFAHDVKVQSYRGQSVLTFWESYGGGIDVILDHSYQQIATVSAGNGFTTGNHEFQITPQGTALINAYRVIPANLRPVGGRRRGRLIDQAIQEVDIATGRVLWQWNALDHIRLTATYAGKPGARPYDYLHMNSIQQLPDGNLLVSARHTWAIYEISKQTGRIVWTLGGKRSTFRIGRGARFEWQHDARMQADGTVTVFDNGDGPYAAESQSRALRIRLNYKRRRATLVRAYMHRPPLLSKSEGAVQLLPDGNTFVGWGSEPYFTQFGRHGKQRFDAHFGPPLQSYRAFRFPWSGQPTTPPDVAAAATPSGTRVFASWNGATEVASWRVLAGPSSAALGPVGQFSWVDFETKMWVGSTQPYVAVQALGADGRVLGTSSVVAR